ncbi:GDSL esterase/lipase [Dichanthelium oligosanthes]|uniref:GDSL esterase/lipase n=1 Tax=Dichanthelium oligosanthes TaxID=888268 RepID=A0A1E5V5S3_9POAL|nr:GDSL esterase/lipase [Dichanthelium oligosanthes]
MMRFLRSASCSSPTVVAFFFFLIAAIGSSTSISKSSTSQTTKYNAMFSFGDSMAETGNICVASSSNSTELDVLTCTHPPYGVTYFGRPSCRWSNGRVVIDFIAQSLGLPLLPPSKSKGKDFRRGANMAITGATAMNFSFYRSLGVEDPVWNHGSLDMQIQWFEEMIPSICRTKQNCKGFLSKSLFQFGGFGGNDYNIQLLELGLTPEQTMNNTPMIVNATVNGIERLIALGAVHIVVPGILPTGCLPLFLTFFAGSSSETDFDQYGCLKSYNRLTEYHSSMLRKQVQILQGKYRSTRIMYADYYSQVYQMVQHPHKFGNLSSLYSPRSQKMDSVAGGGKYNFDVGARCGMPGATTACRDPSARVSWDGIHPTEAANKMIADAWLNGPYCTPPILS